MAAATHISGSRFSPGSDYYSVWPLRITFGLIAAFVLASVVDVEVFSAALLDFREMSMARFGYLETIVMSLALVICILIACLPSGKLRFGQDDDRPEFSNVSWLSMLFGSGLGVGFIFWSIAEPILHAHDNPFSQNIVADANGDSTFAIALTMYHWGGMTQGAYGIIAIALGLCCYRRGLPFRLSSLLYPVLGKYAYGPVGTIAEIATLLATVLGLGTSLGLGGAALAATIVPEGANRFAGISVIIVLIGTISFLCVTTALAKRARVLSLVASALLVFTALAVLIAGPTFTVLHTMFDAGVRYTTIFSDLLFLDPAASDSEWQRDWSISYWGWWIAWAPFVGTFYARISRGRTIRELVSAMMVVPPLGGLVWISIFGGGALGLDSGTVAELTQTTINAPSSAMFALFDALDVGKFEIVLTVAMVAIIFLLGAQSLNAGITGMCLLITGETTVKKCEAFGWVAGMVGVAIIMTTLGGSELMTAAWIGGLIFTPIYILIGVGIVITSAQLVLRRRRRLSMPTTPA